MVGSENVSMPRNRPIVGITYKAKFKWDKNWAVRCAACGVTGNETKSTDIEARGAACGWWEAEMNSQKSASYSIYFIIYQLLCSIPSVAAQIKHVDSHSVPGAL